MKTLAATAFLTLVSLMLPQAGVTQVERRITKPAEECAPPAVVASFLGFTEGQAEQFGSLLGQFEATEHGLQEQIAARQSQLDALLSQPNPNPGAIGALVLQIHALQQQVEQVIANFQSQFASLLSEEQRQKVAAVTQASQLQPVVGAFVGLYLVPAPTPLPCQNNELILP